MYGTCDWSPAASRPCCSMGQDHLDVQEFLRRGRRCTTYPEPAWQGRAPSAGQLILYNSADELRAEETRIY